MNWELLPIDNRYEVSDAGLVRWASTRRVKKHDFDRYGYPRVSIGARKKNVHVLVAVTFLGEKPSTEHQVAHNDGDKTNNSVSNLRWALPKENAADRIKHGTNSDGENNGRSLLTRSDVLLIRELYSEKTTTQAELAERFGVAHSTIGMIVTMRRWK